MVRQELVTQLINRILANACTYAGHYIGKPLYTTTQVSSSIIYS